MVCYMYGRRSCLVTRVTNPELWINWQQGSNMGLIMDLPG